LSNKLAVKIKVQIDQIDELFVVYGDLLQKTRRETPDPVELAALGSILHSFYNGLENIFLRVAKELDRDIPAGSDSHRALLSQIGQPTPLRPALLSRAVTEQLESYLLFRHFYRHSYTYLLNWVKLEPLVASLEAVWSQAKAELNTFLDHLSVT
jgi:HepT-like protein